jgi:hypothetical protein
MKNQAQNWEFFEFFFLKFKIRTNKFWKSKNPTMVTTLLETIVFNNKIRIEQEHVSCSHTIHFAW